MYKWGFNGGVIMLKNSTEKIVKKGWKSNKNLIFRSQKLKHLGPTVKIKKWLLIFSVCFAPQEV